MKLANALEQELEQEFSLKGMVFKHNLSKSQLFKEAIANDRGRVKVGGGDNEQKAYATKLGEQGPLMFYTDPQCTGRPVNDTFAVAWPEVADDIWWKENFKPFAVDQFQPLLDRIIKHLNERGRHLYVQDVYAGADANYAVPYRFIGEYATHAMFALNQFPKNITNIENEAEKRWTMINVQSFICDPERDGTRTDRAAIIDFRNRICLVAGRADYCGLVKKTIFTVMNYLLPKAGYLSMHCSANIGQHNDSAVMFGLSGTGKTTLSADPDRKLIGDDETAWTGQGLSNIEDGCYAKLIDLNKEAEPVIAAALSMPGTIIENVPPLPGKPLSETHPQELDLADRSISENTRFSYPLHCNPNVAEGARGGHPKTIVLLTADAFGVLPPISLLKDKDVMYHFVQGFTAKLAGTEVGVKEPKAAFSACFGAPFMSLKPSVYANLLQQKMAENDARCVLLNTGWSGGRAGVADRISIDTTRALLNAALNGQLDDVETERHPVFGLAMPKSCPEVDANVLNPKNCWQNGKEYDIAANQLRDMFRANFSKSNYNQFGIEAVM